MHKAWRSSGGVYLGVGAEGEPEFFTGHCCRESGQRSGNVVQATCTSHLALDRTHLLGPTFRHSASVGLRKA